MTAPNWTASHRETKHAPRPLEEHRRDCDRWFVGESTGTWGTPRRFFVAHRHAPGAPMVSTRFFRKRFATAEAAMAAVEKHIKSGAR